MTKVSHQVTNLSIGIALSFHWPVWFLLFLGSSIPDLLDRSKPKQFGGELQHAFYHTRSRVEPHRGFFHTYSIWTLLAFIIVFFPIPLREPIPVGGFLLSPIHLKAVCYIFVAGIFLHLIADTGSKYGCSVILPCQCHKLGYCRCPWYTRRLALRWYKTGEPSETLFVLFFSLACLGLAFCRWKLGWDIFTLLP